MGRAKASRKLKSPDQIRQEGDAKMRKTLTGAGVPEFRVAGAKVHDFIVDDFTDIHAHRKERRQVLRLLYPHIVDRWLAEGALNGDPGFQEPQRRAVEHCRGLWALLGGRRLTANYDGVAGGSGDGESQQHAINQLAEYQREIPVAFWRVFENVVRFDMPAGIAGSDMANNTPQQQAHAKSCVGFVASLIAQWRGY